MRKNHDLFLRFDALQMTKRWDILFHFHRKRLLSFLFHHLFGQIFFYFQIFKAWSFVTSCVKFLLLSFISFLYQCFSIFIPFENFQVIQVLVEENQALLLRYAPSPCWNLLYQQYKRIFITSLLKNQIGHQVDFILK